MPFFYKSGEEIKQGDRITYHDEPGEIEFVAEKIVGDAALDWYVTEHGGGAMIIAKNFGSVFVHNTADSEDLILISRKESKTDP